jgi:hypothetical protein
MQDKKPFWETKIGKIIGGAKEILPNNGVLGVLKNLIDTDEVLTPQEKEEAHKQLIEAYKAEVNDRDSARKREVEVSKTKKFDFMFNLTGFISLMAFAYIVYAITNMEIPESNSEVWIHLIGVTEGVMLSIVGYYFGSAMKQNK